MGWEQAKNRMVGDNGEERAGKAAHAEVMYNRGSAAERLGAEREYAAGAVEAQAEGLRKELGQAEASLAAVEASIEAIVAQIQKGEKVASESKSAAAKEINAKLAAESQTEKLRLLEEKNALLGKRKKLEDELAAL
jgi:hypothetical protein